MRPLGRLGRQGTHNSYVMCISRYVRFLITSLELEARERCFKMTSKVEDALRNLKDVVIAASSEHGTGAILNSTVFDWDEECDLDDELEGDELDPGEHPPIAVHDPFRRHYDGQFHSPHSLDSKVLPALHRAVFTCLARDLESSPGHYDPFIIFSVLRCLGPDGKFKHISTVPPVLAKLQYGIRITVFWEMILHHQEASLLHPTSLYTQSQELLSLIKKGNPKSVFGTNHQALLETGRIVRRLTRRARFTPVSRDGTTFLFDDCHTLAVPAIRRMVQAMLATTEEKFLKIFMGTHIKATELPDLTKIIDDQSRNDFKYSIFNDPRNHLAKYRNLLLEKLILSGECVRRVDGKITHDREAWLKRSNLIADFVQSLMACNHIMNGGTFRGTEICLASYANPARGLRHWRWVACRGLFYSGYAKTSVNVGYDILVARIQCWRLSYMTFMHLLIIRPVDDFISTKYPQCFPSHHSGQVLQQLSATYVYFTQRRVLEPEALTTELNWWTEQYLGAKFGISAIRQIWCYLKNYFTDDSNTPDHSQVLLDAQAGDSIKRQRTRSSPPTPEDNLACFREISDMYHKALGIDQEDVCDITSESQCQLSLKHV